jgi:PAS domain S-box-containing protein
MSSTSADPAAQPDPPLATDERGGLAPAELLRAVAEVSKIPLVISRRRDGEILYCNEELARIVGLPASEVVGRCALDFYYDPAERDAVLKDLREHGRIRDRQLRLKTHSGAVVRASFSIEPLKVSGEPALLSALHGLCVLGLEATTDEITQEQLAIQALECANQSLRDAQLQLLKTEKMASLGMLMAGVAHEIRTPMGAVSSTQRTLANALDRLARELGEAHPQVLSDSKIGRLLKVLTDSARVVGDGSSRVMDIVQRLRKFSCADEAKLCRVDVNAIAEETLALVHHELKHHVAIQKCYGEGVSLIGYPARLNQVLVNLLVNAAQAVRARGRGKIMLATRALGEHIEITVSDDGVGIPPENLARIFACGFTTKQAEGGSGLGLSISKEIVQAHGGSLEVSSQVGLGTTFTVRLPRSLPDRRSGGHGCPFG